MSRLRSRILSQFGRPSGALGALAGAVMAHRGSNQRRNAWTVQLLDIQPDDRVLEIGYGQALPSTAPPSSHPTAGWSASTTPR